MTGAVRFRLNGFLLLITIVSTKAFALDPYEWDDANATDPRAYPQVQAQFAKELDLYDYAAVFNALLRDLDNSTLWSKQENVYTNLRHALSTLAERFSHFDIDLAQADRQQLSVQDFLDRYPTGLFQFPCPNGECFGASEFRVTYDELMTLADAQAEDFLYRVSTIDRLLNRFKQPALSQTVQAIHNAKARWEIYLRDGMTQFPWEAALNSWLIGAEDIERPPSRQWIFLHPALGVEMSTGEIKEIQAKESLAIELLGHVWYSWRDFDSPEDGLRWWGVSLVTTLRDDIGPGVGLLAHYNQFVTLGITWHDDDEDDKWFDNSPYLLLGVDLFRFAEERAPKY